MRYKTELTAVSEPQFLALVYHDIFSYPLKKTELSFWQIGKGRKDVRRMVEKTGSFYHLSGKTPIVARRLKAKSLSQPKWQVCKKAARVLAVLPTVKFVGVSGALAMNIAAAEDDIDLIVICQRNSLFTTRLLSYLALRFFNLRVRRAKDREIAGKLCLNLWLDEENLEFKKRQDIYTAHEILQVKTLVNKDSVYERFLVLNSWVSRFFPEAFGERLKETQNAADQFKELERKTQKSTEFLTSAVIQILRLGETPARLLQFWYMRKHRTVEEVGAGYALFHPLPWRELVLKTFEARLRSVAQGKYPKVYTITS